MDHMLILAILQITLAVVKAIAEQLKRWNSKRTRKNQKNNSI